MDYKVVITSDAEEDLEGFIRDLLFVKGSEQAAANVLDVVSPGRRGCDC